MPPRRSVLAAPTLVAVAAILAGAIAAAPASASNGKQFILKMSAPAVPDGTVTATIENPSDARQQVGSVNLTPPSSLTATAARVTAAPAGSLASARVTGGIVEVRDLDLAPGKTAKVTIDVTATCASSTTWSVRAKQSNDFNGTGNDIALWEARSVLTTSVAGGCKLVWAKQPASAEVGELISGTSYEPTLAKPAVAIETADGTRITGATGDVAVSLAASSVGSGALSGGTSAFGPPNGQAVFSGLRISGAGTYALAARVTSGPYTGLTATSASIRLSELVERCTFDVLCTSSLTRNSTTFTVNALPFGDAPFLTLSADAGLQLRDADCAQSWTNYDSTTALFEVTSTDREKTISVTIPKRIVQLDPDNGAPRVDLCFASPEPFTTKVPGTSGLRFDWDLDGDLDPVYAGLLPDCSSSTPAPCVTQRKKVAGGNGYIEARLPSSLGDPAMRT